MRSIALPSRTTAPAILQVGRFFTPEALASNMQLMTLIREWCLRTNDTPAQFSLAWLLGEKPWIVPIPDTTKLQHLEENLGATHITFTDQQRSEFLTALSAIPVMGARTPETIYSNR
jgi:aryl-alcohol dehydrogenase-like predicted oxidoreductase